VDISTAMKHTPFSKSVRTIGLVTLLSVAVGSIGQQSVQAQNQAQPKAPVACNPQLKGEFYYDFQNIEFTPKQEEAYRKISAAMSKQAEAQMKNVRTEPIPGAPVDFMMKLVGDRDTPEIIAARDTIAREITIAQTALSRRNLSTQEQMRLLTEQYGQYATFYQAAKLRFTPAQIVFKEKMNRDFEAQVMSIFTPQQQQVYRANLVIKRQIEACDTDRTDG
jgi:hypothetical protein